MRQRGDHVKNDASHSQCVGIEWAQQPANRNEAKDGGYHERQADPVHASQSAHETCGRGRWLDHHTSAGQSPRVTVSMDAKEKHAHRK